MGDIKFVEEGGDGVAAASLLFCSTDCFASVGVSTRLRLAAGALSELDPIWTVFDDTAASGTTVTESPALAAVDSSFVIVPLAFSALRVVSSFSVFFLHFDIRVASTILICVIVIFVRVVVIIFLRRG